MASTPPPCFITPRHQSLSHALPSGRRVISLFRFQEGASAFHAIATFIRHTHYSTFTAYCIYCTCLARPGQIVAYSVTALISFAERGTSDWPRTASPLHAGARRHASRATGQAWPRPSGRASGARLVICSAIPRDGIDQRQSKRSSQRRAPTRGGDIEDALDRYRGWRHIPRR